MVKCSSDTEFFAKLHCIRLAFTVTALCQPVVAVVVVVLVVGVGISGSGSPSSSSWCILAWCVCVAVFLLFKL